MMDQLDDQRFKKLKNEEYRKLYRTNYIKYMKENRQNSNRSESE